MKKLNEQQVAAALKKKQAEEALEQAMEKLKVSQDKDMTAAFDAEDDEDVVF